MTKRSVRALVSLTAALALAAVAAPASGEDTATDRSVSTATPEPPVLSGLADRALPPAGPVLASAAEQVTADLEAARDLVPPSTPAPGSIVRPAAPPGSVEAVIQRHFGAAAGAATRIADCESSLDPAAVSATDDHGLFQINRPSHRARFESVTGQPWAAVYDPEVNTRYARWLYEQQGWAPWACRRIL